MNAIQIIEREWPELGADLRKGDLSVDAIRDRAALCFDGEEYGRLCGLLEAHEASDVYRTEVRRLRGTLEALASATEASSPTKMAAIAKVGLRESRRRVEGAI